MLFRLFNSWIASIAYIARNINIGKQIQEITSITLINVIHKEYNFTNCHIFTIFSHFGLLCHLRSIAAHRDHFVRRLSLRLSGSHTFLVVTQSYVLQAIHAFLGMLPVCFVFQCINAFFILFQLLWYDWSQHIDLLFTRPCTPMYQYTLNPPAVSCLTRR